MRVIGDVWVTCDICKWPVTNVSDLWRTRVTCDIREWSMTCGSDMWHASDLCHMWVTCNMWLICDIQELPVTYASDLWHMWVTCDICEWLETYANFSREVSGQPVKEKESTFAGLYLTLALMLSYFRQCRFDIIYCNYSSLHQIVYLDLYAPDFPKSTLMYFLHPSTFFCLKYPNLEAFLVKKKKQTNHW